MIKIYVFRLFARMRAFGIKTEVKRGFKTEVNETIDFVKHSVGLGSSEHFICP